MKRFKLEDIGFVRDNGKLIGMKDIVTVMNELHEENEQLRKENNTLKQSLEEDITRRVEINEVCKERWG